MPHVLLQAAWVPHLQQYADLQGRLLLLVGLYRDLPDLRRSHQGHLPARRQQDRRRHVHGHQPVQLGRRLQGEERANVLLGNRMCQRLLRQRLLLRYGLLRRLRRLQRHAGHVHDRVCRFLGQPLLQPLPVQRQLCVLRESLLQGQRLHLGLLLQR